MYTFGNNIIVKLFCMYLEGNKKNICFSPPLVRNPVSIALIKIYLNYELYYFYYIICTNCIIYLHFSCHTRCVHLCSLRVHYYVCTTRVPNDYIVLKAPADDGNNFVIVVEGGDILMFDVARIIVDVRCR